MKRSGRSADFLNLRRLDYREGTQMRCRTIQDHADRFRIRLMCRAFMVSSVDYYAWATQPESLRAVRNQALLASIRAIHAESRHTYGSPASATPSGSAAPDRQESRGAADAPAGIRASRNSSTTSVADAREDTKQEIFEYIDVFYNRQRRHSTLDYCSPAEFEA